MKELNMKTRKITFALISLLALAMLTSCGRVKKTFNAVKDEDFGSVYIDSSIEDFNNLGFTYGDSCDVLFSNGFELSDIPYYDGYYGKVGKPLICSYPGRKYVSIAYDITPSMWKQSGCDENTKITVTLREKGKYLNMQNTMSMKYSMDRNDYESDEAFCNFRALTGGSIKKNTFFRGASPVNNQNQRAKLTDRLIKTENINYILDLSDDVKNIEKYKNEGTFENSYFSKLHSMNKTALLKLSQNYRNNKYSKSLADGFRKMMKESGPYYIHCVEGKDRTGFVCILIEALCGATLNELEKDYMMTYKNYYNFTKESDAEKYNMVLDTKFKDMIYYICDIPEGQNISDINLKESAIKHLIKMGMTEKEAIDFCTFLSE